MMNLEKRSLMLGTAAALLGSGALMAATQTFQEQNPREMFRRKHLPNVPLITHSGDTVMLYDDLLKDKKVVINFMYTVCADTCLLTTQNMKEARELLGDFANDINFYSFSLTPLEDDPAALREYMEMYEIDSGWTFLTGLPDNIERVRRGLGFVQASAAEDADIANHANMLRVGNEKMVSWGHASGTSSGKSIARRIRYELA